MLNMDLALSEALFPLVSAIVCVCVCVRACQLSPTSKDRAYLSLKTLVSTTANY